MAKAKVEKITLSQSRDIPFDRLVLSSRNVRRVRAGVSIAELAEDIARRVIRAFDETVPSFYSEQDLKRGYVTAVDRRGQVIRFPLITISIGIVTNAHRTIENHWVVGEIAAQVKRRAKDLPGSSYYLDQRR
jgi:hypothetical protein